MKRYVEENEAELYSLLKALCLIPAPSGKEEKRAEFCYEWLGSVGAEGVYLDEAKNVVFPFKCEGRDDISVFLAHTDTVFPDLVPMPYVENGDIIRCPSVCDDTASLVVLLLCAKFVIENKDLFSAPILFVCNSCEEGLGNLKGTKQIFSEYEGRISQFISFDSLFGKIATRCVGSHRYEVQVTTEGGHSYQAFGNKNAIAELSRIVDEIYKIEVPKKEGARTSYNVGMISGGTSVNTIAQNAEMLCEYRSNDVECLSFMKKKFEEIFENAKKDDVGVSVKLIGERPCMKDVDEEKIEEMFQKCKKITEEVIGREVISALSSTDCNIPLSLGIPAICIAVCEGDGIHTREEWLRKSSLPQGLEVGIKSIIALLKGEAK
ncbi:MAG: M20/M25/M40 family metallo-hydrolase [Clostridia bacterium]|nr:M20/M25/M40 family metallo-hydrolase [Clostridia bacterium]